MYTIKSEPLWGSFHLEARTDADLEYVNEKGLNKETLFSIHLVNVTDNSSRPVGRTRMAPFPGCCGIVISFDTHLESSDRHSVISTEFRKLKEKMAKEFGYSKMIATTQMSNIPAVGNFFKSKYKFIDTFVNKRTGNLLGIGLKNL